MLADSELIRRRKRTHRSRESFSIFAALGVKRRDPCRRHEWGSTYRNSIFGNPGPAGLGRNASPYAGRADSVMIGTHYSIGEELVVMARPGRSHPCRSDAEETRNCQVHDHDPEDDSKTDTTTSNRTPAIRETRCHGDAGPSLDASGAVELAPALGIAAPLTTAWCRYSPSARGASAAVHCPDASQACSMVPSPCCSGR